MSVYYRAGYKYQLMAPFDIVLPLRPPKVIVTEWLRLNPSGLLEIARGYAWDGPSGPTVDTKSAIRGSLVHDSLYQFLRLGLLPPYAREQADDIYHDLCLEDGMGRIRAWLHFKALRAFGWKSAIPGAERAVLMAP